MAPSLVDGHILNVHAAENRDGVLGPFLLPKRAGASGSTSAPAPAFLAVSPGIPGTCSKEFSVERGPSLRSAIFTTGLDLRG